MEGGDGNGTDLPTGWVTIVEENGNRTIESYKNTETGQIFYSKKAVHRYINYQRRASLLRMVDGPMPYGHCTRCWHVGHTAAECVASEATVAAFHKFFVPPRFKRGESAEKTKYECSRCGYFGHNIRSCRQGRPRF